MIIWIFWDMHLRQMQKYHLATGITIQYSIFFLKDQSTDTPKSVAHNVTFLMVSHSRSGSVSSGIFTCMESSIRKMKKNTKYTKFLFYFSQHFLQFQRGIEIFLFRSIPLDQCWFHRHLEQTQLYLEYQFKKKIP